MFRSSTVVTVSALVADKVDATDSRMLFASDRPIPVEVDSVMLALSTVNEPMAASTESFSWLVSPLEYPRAASRASAQPTPSPASLEVRALSHMVAESEAESPRAAERLPATVAASPNTFPIRLSTSVERVEPSVDDRPGMADSVTPRASDLPKPSADARDAPRDAGSDARIWMEPPIESANPTTS